QRERNGATIGLLKMLFEVHLGNLPGEGRFTLLLLLLLVVQGLFVGSESFSGSRAVEHLLRDTLAKLGELVEGFPQMRIASTQNGISLCCQGFCADGLAAKDQVEGS